MQRRASFARSLAFASAVLSIGGVLADTIDSPAQPGPTPKRVPVRQLTEADAERIAAAQAKRERKAKKRAARPQGEPK